MGEPFDSASLTLADSGLPPRVREVAADLLQLARADLVDGGQRSDGYRFVGSIKDGLLMISAGCRYFAIADAREHWKHREGTPLGAETTCILDHIEKVAAIRGLLPATKQEAA